MSTFGSSEWPKPIVGRPTGIDKTGNLARAYMTQPCGPPIKGDPTRSPFHLTTYHPPHSYSVLKCTLDCPPCRSSSLPLFSIPSPVPHSPQTETAVFTHQHHQHG